MKRGFARLTKARRQELARLGAAATNAAWPADKPRGRQLTSETAKVIGSLGGHAVAKRGTEYMGKIARAAVAARLANRKKEPDHG